MRAFMTSTATPTQALGDQAVATAMQATTSVPISTSPRLLDRCHGEKREHERLLALRSRGVGHRERCGRPNVAESRKDRTYTAPEPRAKDLAPRPEPEGQQHDAEEERENRLTICASRATRRRAPPAMTMASLRRDRCSEQEPAQESDAVRAGRAVRIGRRTSPSAQEGLRLSES